MQSGTQNGTSSTPRTATSGFITSTPVPTSGGNVSYGYGGYKCTSCNVWVANGTTHFCNMAGSVGSLGYTYTWPTNRDGEILSELQAIRRLLEGKALTELSKRIEKLEEQAQQSETEWKDWQTP